MLLAEFLVQSAKRGIKKYAPTGRTATTKSTTAAATAFFPGFLATAAVCAGDSCMTPGVLATSATGPATG